MLATLFALQSSVTPSLNKRSRTLCYRWLSRRGVPFHYKVRLDGTVKSNSQAARPYCHFCQ
jgi:hypothetical protein